MLSEKNDRTIKIEIDLEITNSDIEDIVSTALCGGIGYWTCLDNTREEWNKCTDEVCTDEYATQLLIDGKSLYFLDAEEETGEIWELTLEKLLKGIKQTLTKHDPSLLLNSQLDLDNLDAELADVIFQYALFDEIVYG